MDYRETALQILQGIGGEENVVNLEHCSTRLLFTVADKGRVDVDALQKTKGVLQVIINSQVQVVIGNAVIWRISPLSAEVLREQQHTHPHGAR